MITIENNQIARDGEIIGSIIGEIAWMKAKPAGRIAGQIRQVAGINGLKFEVDESPPLSAVQVVDTLSETEPAAVCDDAAAGNKFKIGLDWGTPGTAYFARCFINHYGPDGYSRFCKANGI